MDKLIIRLHLLLLLVLVVLKFIIRHLVASVKKEKNVMVQVNARLHRKQLWRWVLLLFLLTACGAEEVITNAAPTVPAGPATQGDVIPTLQVAVVSDDFAVGTPRVPFVLYDGPDRVSTAQKVKVTLFDLTQNPPQPGAFFWATGYNDYVALLVSVPAGSGYSTNDCSAGCSASSS